MGRPHLNRQHHRLRENSQSLGGKIPQRLRRTPSDDPPSASSLIRRVRTRDDSGLPPTRRSALALALALGGRTRPHAANPPRRRPLPQLHASRPHTPDVHDRNPPLGLILPRAPRRRQASSDMGPQAGPSSPQRARESNDILQTPLHALPGGEHRYRIQFP
jgi:hypothetical protein